MSQDSLFFYKAGRAGFHTGTSIAGWHTKTGGDTAIAGPLLTLSIAGAGVKTRFLLTLSIAGARTRFLLTLSKASISIIVAKAPIPCQLIRPGRAIPGSKTYIEIKFVMIAHFFFSLHLRMLSR